MAKYIPINQSYIEVNSPEHMRHMCRWERLQPKEYWEYRRKWEEYPKKQIVAKFPLNLEIECTRRCNLRCPMCPRAVKIANGEKIVEGDMDFELFKKIIDEGSKNGLYAIKLSYLGEPLLSRDLPKMIAYAKKKGVIDTIFNTNGSLLTEETSKKLITAGLDKIFISFDSPNPEHYNKIRIGTNFDRVFENVKRLAELRKSMRLIKPLIRVSMTVMQENKEEVLDYIKLWSPIVDSIGMGVYANPGHKDKKAGSRTVTKPEEHKNFICSQLYQRLFIHWDGKIGLCCTDYDASLGLGNARDVNIKDVWLGQKMKQIRNFHNQGKWEKIPLCRKCDLPRM